jgi:hypothetical protein
MSAPPPVGVKHFAQTTSTAVEQDSLVAGTDTEDAAHLLARHAFHVAKDDDGTLARREILQSRFEDRRPHCGFEAVIGLLRPALHGIGPLTLSVEASWIDGLR